MKKNIKSIAAIGIFLFSASFISLRAGDKPPEDASAKGTTCDTDAGTYAHGALSFFHSQICQLNVQFPGIAEEFLYKLVVNMGMNPDVTALASDGTPTTLTSKTVAGKVIGGTVRKVVSPDTFSGFYENKAVITMDAVTFMTLYWSGTASSSKGFLTLGGAGFGTTQRLLYVNWDRTTSVQTVNVMGARMASTYLSSPLTDDALYGSISYDKSTKDTTLQMVRLGKQRGSSPSATVFACFKSYAIGTSGGAMRVGKTDDSHSSSGHLRTLTSQDGIDEMDDWEGNDTKTEANGTGNGTPVQGFTMNYSCADLNSAGGSSKPFDSNAVNHSMTKSQMDAMFGAN
jgi:hypothetical protein